MFCVSRIIYWECMMNVEEMNIQLQLVSIVLFVIACTLENAACTRLTT